MRGCAYRTIDDVCMIRTKTVIEYCQSPCPVPEAAAPELAPIQNVASLAIQRVTEERERQMELWGDQSDNHPFEWVSILGEEFGELCEAVNETCFQNGTHPERGGQDKIIKEATQVAAVAVAIIESVMRKKGAEE